MEANIYINGEIGENVTLVDVIKQVQGNPFATTFNVYINSVGGYVDIGFDIYNYLISLKKEGKIVNTIGQGVVASIATVIFMAGESRKLRKNTEFMIHLPFGQVQGTSEEIDLYNNGLKEAEKKIVKFYQETTGLSEEAIKPMLKQETWLNDSEAFDLKFTTEQEIDFPMVAKASINLNTNNKMTDLSEKDKSWIEEKFASIKNLFKSNIKNIVLQDANGSDVEFPNVADGTMPIVGDEIVFDGSPLDGEVTMPDGTVYVGVGGLITEIKAPQSNSTDEQTQRIAELEKQLADAKAEAEANKVEAQNSADTLAKVEKEVMEFKNQITSKFKAELTPREPKPAEPTTTSAYAELVKKAKQKNK